jgi:hypothetical protein
MVRGQVMATTLVLNNKGMYESMFIKPRDVREALVGMYMPDVWQQVTVNLNYREERWFHNPTETEILFSVDTSVPMNPVRLVLSQGNLVLVQMEVIGLDADGYASMISILLTNMEVTRPIKSKASK